MLLRREQPHWKEGALLSHSLRPKTVKKIKIKWATTHICKTTDADISNNPSKINSFILYFISSVSGENSNNNKCFLWLLCKDFFPSSYTQNEYKNRFNEHISSQRRKKHSKVNDIVMHFLILKYFKDKHDE